MYLSPTWNLFTLIAMFTKNYMVLLYVPVLFFWSSRHYLKDTELKFNILNNLQTATTKFEKNLV